MNARTFRTTIVAVITAFCLLATSGINALAADPLRPIQGGFQSEIRSLSPDAISAQQERLRRELRDAEASNDLKTIQRVSELLGDLCYLQGEYDKAMSSFQRSLSLCGTMGNNECTSRSLKKIADVHYYQSHYQEAQEAYVKAQAVADTIGDPKLRAAILTNLGRIYRVWGKRDKAMSCHTEAAQFAMQSGDREVEAYTHNNIGNLFKDRGKHIEALEHYRKSLFLARESSDRRGEGLALANLAEIHVQLGKYERAADYGNDALTIQRQLGDSRLEAGSLANLGSVYVAWGRYAKAEDCYVTALRLSAKMQYRHLESKILDLLGQLYAARGQYTKALKSFRDSLHIISETKDPKTEGRCLLDIGKICAQQGNHAQALTHFAQVLAMWQTAGVSTEEPHDLMGGLYLDLGQLDKAEEHITRSGCKSALGRLALAKGNNEAATHYYQDVLESAERSGDANLRFTAYTGLGRAYEGLTDYPRAERYFELSVSLTEEIRSSLIPAQRSLFFDVKINGFQRCDPARGLTRVRMKANRAAKSIDSSEVTRARAFADGLSTRKHEGYAGVPPQVLAEEERAVNAVAGLRQARNKLSRETDPERYRNLTGEIARADAELQRFVDSLWKDYPAYASVKYPRPVSLKQSALGSEEFALVYDVSEEGVGIKLIRGSDIVQTHYRKWRITDLEADIKRFRASFDQCQLSGFDTALAKSLYRKLLGPVLMDVPEGAPIVIIPDGVLGLLPFEALVMAGTVTWDKSGTFPVPKGLIYVGDVYPVSYYQSITALTLTRRLGKQTAPAKRTLVLADPIFSDRDPRVTQSQGSVKQPPNDSNGGLLMAASQELGVKFSRLKLTAHLADALKLLHPERVDVRLGMQATEASLFSTTLRDFGSMVFATHGYFGKDLPGLREPVLVLTLLNQPEARDGFLTMSEVMGLDLNADIVVLTACQTGVGRNLAGEGIMGMGRAFQWAGARSVLMTLWSVAEQSSVNLVERFCAHRKEGMNKLKALNQARKDIRKQGYDHPFFWAPFVLVGEVR